MHVCMVLDKPYPPDVRVRKEASALRAAGHEVDLLCRATGDQPARETVEEVEVFRHERPDSLRVRWPETVSFLATRVQPRWADRLRDHVERRDVDAVHVHDLPLVATALAVRETTGVPVVADLHENYPEAIRQWRRMDALGDVLHPSRLGERLFLPVRRWKWLERHCVRRADHVLTVVEEGRDHYVREACAPPDEVTVVSNTVALDEFAPDARPPASGPLAADPNRFTVGYVGKYAPHRGLESVLRALPAVVDAAPETHLRIVGAPGTERYGERFDDLAASLGVADRVTVTGWVDFAQVPGAIAACDVCLVPHASTPHTETTVPHKLFQYMAMGRPVVVSDVAPLARIVRATDAGVVAPADDPEGMAAVLSSLSRDPAERRRLGANGRAAVETEYNWSRDAARLSGVYDRIAGA
jgi:glycosyltransferase involved in cell wall biosynthesis